MTYNAKTERALVLSSLLLLILLLTLNLDNWLLYLLIPVLIIVFVTIFMNFNLKILDGFLTFQIRVLSVPVFNKTVSHEQISCLRFKRIGWGRKCVIVKNDKGPNLRIANFNPDTVYNDLINFALEYEVPISKTKDYVILER